MVAIVSAYQDRGVVGIAAIVSLFVLVVVLAVTKLTLKLRLKSAFHKFGYGFLEQILDALHAAYVA